MMNDPYGVQTTYRFPHLRVMSNGQELLGALEASVVTNNYYQCDTFSAQFAMNHPDTTPGWWDVEPPFLVDIQVSLDGEVWTSLVQGEVDHLRPNVQTGLLQVEGRDLSARLIEYRTQGSFHNQTSSEVALALARAVGLKAIVEKTTTLVDRYYEADNTSTSANLDQFSHTTTGWDLLTYLAQREQFDVFVRGTTLYFQAITPPNSDPFVVVWTPPSPIPRLNVISLRLERSLTLAKDIEVQVRSWNSEHERSFTKTSRAIGGKSASATSKSGGKTSTTQKYILVLPNKTEEQAQQLANSLAREYSLHERVVSVDMPGELVLTPRNLVKLQGTATSFDQTYFIASIDRSISVGEGFRQTMRMKNSSPRTQTQV